MSMKHLFHWMLRNLPVWTKFLPECFKAVLGLYVCHSTICSPSHYVMLPYLATSWKIHKILPVFKAGDPNSVRNYRPISLLSNTSKVFEQLIYNKTITHISKSISPFQFGFTKNCSTQQQLLVFIDRIVNSPLQTDVIYLDISGGFRGARGAVAPPPAISGNTKGWMCCYRNTLKHTNSCK